MTDVVPYSNAEARASAEELRSHFGDVAPRVAIILGSGLGALVEDVKRATSMSYGDIPRFSEIHVRGHAGELVSGTLDGVPVLVFSGRFHVYEGHSARAVGFPVRVAHAMGVRTLLVANAAGGMRNDMRVGDLMVIDDQINLTGTSPLLGPQDEGEPRFPDMSDPYDALFRERLHHIAENLQIPVTSGVYIGVLGPAYETRAEIRMFRMNGAHAVGMSTVHEVITAKALGMRVAGLSCIANVHAENHVVPLDHADVLAATQQSVTKFRTLMREFVKTIAS